MSPIVAAMKHRNHNLELTRQVFDVGEAILLEELGILNESANAETMRHSQQQLNPRKQHGEDIASTSHVPCGAGPIS
jgi:hypothetical protein